MKKRRSKGLRGSVIKKGINKVQQKKKKIDTKIDNWSHSHYRKKRYILFFISLLLLILFYLFKDTGYFANVLIAILFIGLFYVFDHYFDIKFRWYHYIFILLMIAAGLLLLPVHYQFTEFDKIQHLIMPIFMSSMVFHMVKRLDLELKWKLVFTFFITIGILGLWEMFEYTLDYFFDIKMQGVYIRDALGLEKLNLIMNPLDDTFFDLFLGTFGTCLYAIFAFIYLRYFKKTLHLKR